MFGAFGLFLYRAVTEWTRSGLGLLTDALIIAIAVTGLNLITGYTGQLSLGHAGFFAIGAFVSAMLVSGKIWTPFIESNMWTPGWTLIAAAVVCFVIGVIVGIPALRLKGIYLALVTLVFTGSVTRPALVSFSSSTWKEVGSRQNSSILYFLPPASLMDVPDGPSTLGHVFANPVPLIWS